MATLNAHSCQINGSTLAVATLTTPNIMEQSILRLKIHAVFGFIIMHTIWSFCCWHCLNILVIRFDTGMFYRLCPLARIQQQNRNAREKNSIAEQWFYFSVTKISHFVLFEWSLRGMKFHFALAPSLFLFTLPLSGIAYLIRSYFFNSVLNANKIDDAYGCIF